MMKPLRCSVGWHRWAGCRCRRCAATRDAEHEWDGTCTCAICGARRDQDHDIAGLACVCRRCSRAVHAFVPSAVGAGHRCERCTTPEPHVWGVGASR